ncbi:MAG: hypothetical protein WEC15_00370 [Flavobacteriales bacterium]
MIYSGIGVVIFIFGLVCAHALVASNRPAQTALVRPKEERENVFMVIMDYR